MRRLLLSLHDVTPAHHERIARLEGILAAAAERDAAWALLVVPDFHSRAPVAGDRSFVAWLRARAAAGCEVFLHGWSHRDEAEHSGAAAWKARRMTAGEGEFLGLSQAEARRRMHDGRALLEDIVGAPLAGFIAPAWLYGPGAVAALAAERFALAEDHWRVWSPATGTTLARGPVVTYASRTPARIRSSLLWSRAATTLLRPLPAVRLAVHPHDVDAPALTAEAARAIGAFALRRRLGRYRDLLPVGDDKVGVDAEQSPEMIERRGRHG